MITQNSSDKLNVLSLLNTIHYRYTFVLFICSDIISLKIENLRFKQLNAFINRFSTMKLLSEIKHVDVMIMGIGTNICNSYFFQKNVNNFRKLRKKIEKNSTLKGILVCTFQLNSSVND